MKDRIEFRFTVATAKLETKELKTITKVLEPFTKRVLEAATKVIEHYAEKEIEKGEE